MKGNIKEELKEIALSLMFKIDVKVLDDIMELWTDLNTRIEWLKEIDTSNVEPLSHINENRFIDFLRDDVEDNSLVSIKKQDLLSNAADFDEKYILTNKVVK
ncbi:glutamyl-tRNA amidotransferase [Mycoplasmopsis bovis]|uniref:Asp-tRNA(Asn)/Glu-tRNA(Gln) amidotransferase subunit GatC n=1 Tax=Mycoplasmopsis bovis TaxID=28903 RepID=UPI000E107616|nr:Asp-tRNA(Asn)/Glu-tRNA(Gln) amidotransferase subunit GatC [Mycoplasmopsis bovis]AXJ70352.1 glutamyl-tRNA amidotransferase [Mycoplasmopsis bovis]MBT1370868.1 glutamyl-tRNA amidotransferase [Mycoplasmopsis bovis]